MKYLKSLTIPQLQLVISLAIFITTYFLILVYKFDFFFPFAWVADVPYWPGSLRITLLIIIIMLYTANYCTAKCIACINTNDYDSIGYGGAAFTLYFIALMCIAIICMSDFYIQQTTCTP